MHKRHELILATLDIIHLAPSAVGGILNQLTQEAPNPASIKKIETLQSMCTVHGRWSMLMVIIELIFLF